MANKALAWIWDYYWKNLVDDDSPSGRKQTDLCRDAILTFLRDGDDETRTARAMKELMKWPVDRVLRTIGDLQDTLPGNQVYLRCLKLSKEVMVARADEAETGRAAAGEQGPEVASSERQREREPEPEEGSEQAVGWFLYQGPWKPKPIGVV